MNLHLTHIVHRGNGNPELRGAALLGYSYIDVASNTLYFKMSGNSTTGWQASVQL